jgi:hypothetical protein
MQTALTPVAIQTFGEWLTRLCKRTRLQHGQHVRIVVIPHTGKAAARQPENHIAHDDPDRLRCQQ